MSSSLIDAVREMCKVWGAQKRYMLTSKAQGWDGQSLLMKFREMYDGAGSGTQRVSQFMEEAHIGEGLLVARARCGAPLKVNEVVFVHYVVPGKAKQKIPHMGISTAEYWRDLENAHYWIAAKMPIVETTVETRKAG
jgi:hypothetical protein